jgi:hypothetical protein
LAHEVIINTWSRAAPIVKKFIAFCGKWRFITKVTLSNPLKVFKVVNSFQVLLSKFCMNFFLSHYVLYFSSISNLKTLYNI